MLKWPAQARAANLHWEGASGHVCVHLTVMGYRMDFPDLLMRMPHGRISKATVKPKYFMHITATAHEALPREWKGTTSGWVIYVSESHVSYCPLPHPGNFANSCQLIFVKERRRNKKGLNTRVWFQACMRVCVHFLFNLCKTLQKFSKGIFVHSITGAEIKCARRSVSGAWLFEGVSFLQCTSGKVLTITAINSWSQSVNFQEKLLEGDPPCLWE